MWFTQLSRQRGRLSSVVFFPLLVGQRVEAAKLGCSASKPCVYPGPVLAGKGAAGGDRRPARPVLRCRGALPSARSLQGTRGFPTHRGADLRPLLRDQAARRTPAPPHPGNPPAGELPVAGRTPRPVTALGLRSGTWQPRAVNAERTLGSAPPPALRAWPPRSTAVPLLGQLARGAVPQRGAGGPAPQPPLPSPARAALARSHRGHPGTARGLRGAWQLAQVCVCRGSPCWGCCPRDPGKRRGGEPVTLRVLVYPCRGGTRVPCPAASGLRASAGSWRVRGCQARRCWLVSPGWDSEGRCLPPAGLHLKPCNVRTFPSSSTLPPWLGQPVLFLRWKERG